MWARSGPNQQSPLFQITGLHFDPRHTSQHVSQPPRPKWAPLSNPENSILNQRGIIVPKRKFLFQLPEERFSYSASPFFSPTITPIRGPHALTASARTIRKKIIYFFPFLLNLTVDCGPTSRG